MNKHVRKYRLPNASIRIDVVAIWNPLSNNIESMCTWQLDPPLFQASIEHAYEHFVQKTSEMQVFYDPSESTVVLFHFDVVAIFLLFVSPVLAHG